MFGRNKEREKHEAWRVEAQKGISAVLAAKTDATRMNASPEPLQMPSLGRALRGEFECLPLQVLECQQLNVQVAISAIQRQLDPASARVSTQTYEDIFLYMSHSPRGPSEGDWIRVRNCAGRYLILVREVGVLWTTFCVLNLRGIVGSGYLWHKMG
jgi:sarcosine oxidase delta subunit